MEILPWKTSRRTLEPLWLCNRARFRLTTLAMQHILPKIIDISNSSITRVSIQR
ncbi:hypothetical protein KP509_38G040400 [Ceratopteris richardii]|uniref:Uncharacterized protein n=1 Tax=Ceratopteris richardii TaxID=49495 RepID=A0A8T2Q475_CERRI|nr:hypothetical protein KP509_38G040400 [Ceratopteris richardii]